MNASSAAENAEDAALDAVVFVDFDGVLHPYGCAEDAYFCRLEIFEGWLRRRPGVDVVISSTWRETRSVSELTAFFADDLKQRVIGVTPLFIQDSWEQFDGEPPPPRFARHIEVLRWLVQSSTPWRRWAALDDQSLLYKPFTRELVICDGRVGLTQLELDKLDDVLRSSAGFAIKP